jgi:hypothetical protein
MKTIIPYNGLVCHETRVSASLFAEIYGKQRWGIEYEDGAPWWQQCHIRVVKKRPKCFHF